MGLLLCPDAGALAKVAVAAPGTTPQSSRSARLPGALHGSRDSRRCPSCSRPGDAPNRAPLPPSIHHSQHPRAGWWRRIIPDNLATLQCATPGFTPRYVIRLRGKRRQELHPRRAGSSALLERVLAIVFSADMSRAPRPGKPSGYRGRLPFTRSPVLLR
ncbi:hypothetical protein VUR80DRAFT_2098 [Thermomyces stellatus]